MTQDFEKLNIAIDDIAIKVKIVDYGNLKAIIALDFGDFNIKGFRVNKSEHENNSVPGEYLWIVPPSYRDNGGRYHPIFYAENKDLWKKIETKIIQEYRRVSTETTKKKFGLTDEDIT